MKPFFKLKIGRGTIILTAMLLAALALRGIYELQPFRLLWVSGDSMEPTIANGSLLWVDTRYPGRIPLRTGDVIQFRHGGDNYIKRVVAMPGDELLMIRTESANAVLIPGWQVIPAIELCRNHVDARLERVIVEEGQLYVVGDNRVASFDSRDFGSIDTATVIGKVLLLSASDKKL